MVTGTFPHHLRRICPLCGQLRALWRCQTPGEHLGKDICVSCGDAIEADYRNQRLAATSAPSREALEKDIRDLYGD